MLLKIAIKTTVKAMSSTVSLIPNRFDLFSSTLDCCKDLEISLLVAHLSRVSCFPRSSPQIYLSYFAKSPAMFLQKKCQGVPSRTERKLGTSVKSSKAFQV